MLAYGWTSPLTTAHYGSAEIGGLPACLCPFSSLSTSKAMLRKQPLASRCSHGDRRRGIAVVELAVCLPVLVLILLSTIEACVMLQLQQNVTITAYEGARIGIIPGIEASAVQAQCQMLLDDRNISGYTITMDPADPTTMQDGDLFTVTVEADCGANSVIGSVFFENRTITESVVMKAE